MRSGSLGKCICGESSEGIARFLKRIAFGRTQKTWRSVKAWRLSIFYWLKLAGGVAWPFRETVERKGHATPLRRSLYY